MQTLILVMVTAVINGILKSRTSEVRKAFVFAFTLLPIYAWLVYFSDDSKRLFGGWLFARSEELSILADFLPRLIVLAGMPILSFVMIWAFLKLLNEPENNLFFIFERVAMQGIGWLSFTVAATVLILGFEAVAKGSLNTVRSLLHGFTGYNCLMVVCISGMLACFLYLVFEMYVAVCTLPELIKLLRYKPKHQKR